MIEGSSSFPRSGLIELLAFLVFLLSSRPRNQVPLPCHSKIDLLILVFSCSYDRRNEFLSPGWGDINTLMLWKLHYCPRRSLDHISLSVLYHSLRPSIFAIGIPANQSRVLSQVRVRLDFNPCDVEDFQIIKSFCLIIANNPDTTKRTHMI